MKNYNSFYNELQSDVALSIILCARSICGIHNDNEIYQAYLEKIDFTKWSNQSIKEHVHNITNGGCLIKLMRILSGSSDLNESESYILIKTLNLFIKTANVVEQPKREGVFRPSDLLKW